jgi:uncharacterized protein YwqG
MSFSLREDLDPDLRQLLEQHWAIVEATIQPYVEIIFDPQPNLSLWQSKIGGFPYLPKSVEYPKGADGSELQFLAQINFAEVPPLPNFPETGILQFYIASNEELYGLDFDNLRANDNFRVLYFSEVVTDETQLITDFSFLPKFEGPLIGSANMQFEKKFAPISNGDYRFDDPLGNLLSEFHDDLCREYGEKVSNGWGHRIGGYPSFTQTDPRTWEESYRENDCLLLQLKSDYFESDLFDLTWGDFGIANFFIPSEALKKLDFSDVLFNWDCG